MSDTPPESASRPSESSAPEVRRGSFGAWLRHQREARSVSLREIADSSKISLRYLDALEQDRFDILPAPVFARGFLREYARVVGLNPDEVVNLFLVAAEERKASAARVEPARVARSRKAPSSFGYGLLLALAVIAFLGIAAALSFYVERRGEKPQPATSFVAPASPEPPRPEPVAQAVESPAPAAPTAATDGAVTAGSAAQALPESAATAPPAATQPAPAAPADGRLQVVVSFREDCWVETVVDGKRRTSELRAGGETIALDAEQYVLLTLGNSAAVSVEVNGRPFALPASATRVVRQLRIDRAAAGLAAAPAGSP